MRCERQRGVALLAAILLVAIGSILAAAIAFQTAMAARRASASLAFDHSVLISEGAEALAAYALRQDLKDSPEFDYAGEQWSTPLQPVEVVPGVVLEASAEDLQGRFNLNSLVYSGNPPPPSGARARQIDPVSVEILQRLLENLGLESNWAELMADWIDADNLAYGSGGGEDSLYTGQDPPYRTPNGYITSTSELLALPGFGRERYLKLAPFVTALPPDAATVNLCSASIELLNAMSDGHFGGDAATLAKNRDKGCFPKKDSDFKPVFPTTQDFDSIKDRVDEKSSYFRLTSLVTIGTTEVTLYSLLQRDSSGSSRPVHVLQRGFTPD